MSTEALTTSMLELTPLTRVASTLHTPLGIGSFDRECDGVVAGTFNLMETPDDETAVAMIGHFLGHALQRGARATLVTFDNPALMLPRLASYGFDFSRVLEDEQLLYIYYRPTLSRALGLTGDFAPLFSELRRLTGPVERIGFLNADVLFNLESEQLATASVASLAAASARLGTTALGCYVSSDCAARKRLKTASASLLPGAYQLHRAPPALGANRYQLDVLKAPGRRCVVNLTLQEGRGYVESGRGLDAQIA